MRLAELITQQPTCLTSSFFCLFTCLTGRHSCHLDGGAYFPSSSCTPQARTQILTTNAEEVDLENETKHPFAAHGAKRTNCAQDPREKTTDAPIITHIPSPVFLQPLRRNSSSCHLFVPDCFSSMYRSVFRGASHWADVLIVHKSA